MLSLHISVSIYLHNQLHREALSFACMQCTFESTQINDICEHMRHCTDDAASVRACVFLRDRNYILETDQRVKDVVWEHSQGVVVEFQKPVHMSSTRSAHFSASVCSCHGKS